MYEVTILIPTRNEAGNVKPLVQQIHASMNGVSHKIVFLDDSTDDTPDVIEKLRTDDDSIGLLHRPKEARNGLAGAVVDGLYFADSPIIAVMDGDLQHPPSILPRMVESLKAGADFVIGSRYAPGGSDGGLKGIRKLISWGARTIAHICLPKLRKVSDSTSGFFAFRNMVHPSKLNPVGWKIMIEILIKGEFKRIEEIPIQFEDRLNEQSKMSLIEQFNFLRHLTRLGKHSPMFRYIKFAAVGLVGVGVNQILLYVFLVRESALEASISASMGAMVFNYMLNSRWTWKTRQKHGVFALGTSVIYFAVALLGVMTTAGVFDVLHDFGLRVGLAQLIGIGLTSVWTFVAHNTLTFRGRRHVEAIKAK